MKTIFCGRQHLHVKDDHFWPLGSVAQISKLTPPQAAHLQPGDGTPGHVILLGNSIHGHLVDDLMQYKRHKEFAGNALILLQHLAVTVVDHSGIRQ
eukprot:1157271-Pelagomonas_calceolata.AAC.12